MKIKLEKLAKDLGFSVSTISKALRDSHEISSNTKKTIKDYADKIGYIVSPHAQFLRPQKQNQTIAVIVPELTNNFFIQAINGIQSIAQQNEYHVLVYNSFDDELIEKSIFKHLQLARVDGVLISVSQNTKSFEHFIECIGLGIPVFFFDRVCYEIETVKVVTNDYNAAFIATEHLIKQKCIDISFLSVSNSLSINQKRMQGYVEALRKHNLPINEKRIVFCQTNEEEKIKKLLKGRKRPEGIIASVEKLALSTYRICRELKIEIPENIKIACFSNLRTADLLNPSLTTITQPAFEMGVTSAKTLIEFLETKSRGVLDNKTIVLDSILEVRDSSR